MKKFLLWTVRITGGLIVLLIGSVVLLQYRTYDAPFPDIHASADSVIIARGKYLVTGPAHCADCHASPDQASLLALGKPVSLNGGKEFKGDIGTLRAPNITSDRETGVGNLSDGQIARALRYGVDHKGKALFPLMPFQNLSDGDLRAIISYLRTMEPVKHEVKPKSLNALGYVVNAFFIKPVGPTGLPPGTVIADSSVTYGAYLAKNVANCVGCHTDRDLKTGAFTSEPFSGGFHMQSPLDPAYECVTPNLTPDGPTGRMTNWTEAQFIQRFGMGKSITHSEMPWGPFKNMNESDLKALYRFLHTLKPVTHETGPSLVRKQ